MRGRCVMSVRSQTVAALCERRACGLRSAGADRRYRGGVCVAVAQMRSKRAPFGLPQRNCGPNGSRLARRGATEVQTGAGWGAGALRQVKRAAFGSPGRYGGRTGSRSERICATAGQTGAVGSTVLCGSCWN